jgi:predicted Fe-Mo cluster-binding NifX family protein
MKIAVASQNKHVAGHFGHCEGFDIFDVEDEIIVNSEFVKNPGHIPGFLPNYLNDMGVDVIISGGMGGGAVAIFNEKGINVVTGAMGSSEENVKKYIDGKLKSTGSVCHEHQHRENCGEHGEQGHRVGH